MSLSEIHSRLAISVMLFTGLATIWGLVSYIRGKRMGGQFWGILAIGEFLFILQIVFGIILWLGGARPMRDVHLIYGAVTVLAIPGYFAISKGRDDRTATLAYTLIFIFLVGISARAAMTGGA
jgi:hypothetical protein